jgi:hypothetical protein
VKQCTAWITWVVCVASKRVSPSVLELHVMIRFGETCLPNLLVRVPGVHLVGTAVVESN